MLHTEFVTLVNKAGLINAQTTNLQARELAKEIAIFTDAGSSCLKTGHILQAVYAADFCWSLLDCAVAIVEGAAEGVITAGHLFTEPVKTVKNLGEAVNNAAHCLAKILSFLELEDEDFVFRDPKGWKQLTTERRELYTAFIDYFSEPRNAAKEVAAIGTCGWATGKLLGVTGKFFSDTRHKIYEMTKKLIGTAEEAAAVAAEGLPVQFKIAEETTQTLMEKIGNRLESGISQLKNSTKRYKKIAPTNERCRLSRPADYSKLAEWEKDAYEKIRHLADDVEKISKNTGISKDKISKVKQHLFHDEHLLRDGKIRRFDADHEIAEAWDRLINDDFIRNDLNLLEHEYCEAVYMQTQNTRSYEAAHKFAQGKYPWFANEYV